MHFSSSAPDVIPAVDDDDYEESNTPRASVDMSGHVQQDHSGREIGIVLYDFTADGDDELSVVEGERLIILEKDGDEWWKCQNSKRSIGVVPASYIEACFPWKIHNLYICNRGNADFWGTSITIYVARGRRRYICRREPAAVGRRETPRTGAGRKGRGT